MADYPTIPASLVCCAEIAWCRQTSEFLLQRSLEHVVGVFVRNLTSTVSLHEAVRMHILVGSGDAACEVYQSEPTHASMNPQWNFLTASAAVLDSSQRQSSSFSLHVTSESTGLSLPLRPPPCHQRRRRTPPSWMPTSGTASAGCSPRTVFRTTVDLADAVHLGGDPFLKLTPDSLSSEITDAYKKYIERSSDGDLLKAVFSRDPGASANEGEAALCPCLEMLPPNTTIVALEDGFYVQQAVYDVMFHRQRLPWQVLGRTQRPLPPPSSTRPAAAADSPAVPDTPEAAGPLTRRRPMLPSSPVPPPSPVAGGGRTPLHSEGGPPRADSCSIQLPQLLEQITQLADLNELELQADAELADVLREIAAIHSGTPAGTISHSAQVTVAGSSPMEVHDVYAVLVPGAHHEAAVQLPAQDTDAELRAAEVLDLSQQCTDEAFHMLAQLRVFLMNDLRHLYPVDTVRRGELYKIKGVQLPEGAFNKAPAEQVGTALGHTAHCVYLAAQHLGVPLRFKPVPRASFSYMQDDVSNMEPLPLFLKNSDPAQFARAYQMLQVCVQQIARATGTKLPFGPSGHVLGNLHAVFENVGAQGPSW